ncbi:conserved hypothetical protein [Leishmania braziliensis MHOM/BR/75/M2904]|uniref:Trypanosoma Tc-38 (p38) protein domain-containing protein n=1 Tax=Leishmania braziliensis TaxID=5660 RepID=A4HCU0_LEIBR|nr:conserved hypothetical protein [Leishmania braziliensis MHOM/BR/75/M2904]CAM36586.1 conserved hypothetical protein [Leishmania braziliensis MHOM/BR/75/M2904]
MLKHTCHLLVVFTQGVPALKRFAQFNFLPSNPLSSSCLWLDEDDFRATQATASALNVPNPLRIDPYAHHPRLSRFAPAQARVTANQEERVRKTSDAKDKTHNGVVLARTVAAHGAGLQAAHAAGAEVPDQLHTAADDYTAGHEVPTGPVPTGDHSGVGAQHSTEEATPLRHRRGRPPGNTVAAAEDGQHYQVPICTVTLTKSLYLFNMDQMYLFEEKGTALSSLAAHRLGNAEVDGYDAEHDDAITALSPRDRGFPDSEGQLALSVGSTLPRDGSTIIPSEVAPLLWSQEHHIMEGVRMLQLNFPNIASDQCSSQGFRRMYSIHSRRPYALMRQKALNLLAHRHGYHSQWWGTYKQWLRIGAVPLPGQAEHIVPIAVPSKVVHISLIEDAETVLQRCLILAKHKKLIYFFSGYSHQRGSPESRGGDMGAQSPAHAWQPLRSLSCPGTPVDHGSRVHGFEKMLICMQEDMRVNRWSLPVYFTLRQIRRFELKLRPDAVGLLPASAGAAGAHYIHATAEAVETENGKASAADEGVTTAADTLATTDSANTASTECRGGRALPFGTATIPTTQSTMATARGSAETFQYWYHISQVYFPDSYLVPSVVLTAEFENPGVALNGVSGQRLPYPALLYESLVNQHPEVAAAVRQASVSAEAFGTHHATSEVPRESTEHHGSADARGELPVEEGSGRNQDIASPCASSAAGTFGSAYIKVDEEELAIARFVATNSSPKRTQGRSLWYQAQDVLAAGGVVDVNSAPVEVMERPAVLWIGQTEAGSSDVLEHNNKGELRGAVLYNVGCLMEPDEALRLLSVPFDPI